MKVSNLIETLQKLDPEKTVFAQVVAEDNSVWNCWFDVNDIPNTKIVQLRIWHDELKTLKEQK